MDITPAYPPDKYSELYTESPQLKEIREAMGLHLRRELDIMEMVFELDRGDTNLFRHWFTNHSIIKGIEEIHRVVRGGRTNSKSSQEGQILAL